MKYLIGLRLQFLLNFTVSTDLGVLLYLSFIREFIHSLSERVKCANERLGLGQRYAFNKRLC